MPFICNLNAHLRVKQVATCNPNSFLSHYNQQKTITLTCTSYPTSPQPTKIDHHQPHPATHRTVPQLIASPSPRTISIEPNRRSIPTTKTPRRLFRDPNRGRLADRTSLRRPKVRVIGPRGPARIIGGIWTPPAPPPPPRYRRASRPFAFQRRAARIDSR